MTDDPATQTVAADVEGRVSVVDLDDCPRCGRELTFFPATAWPNGDANHVFCFTTGCDFHAERPANSEERKPA